MYNSVYRVEDCIVWYWMNQFYIDVFGYDPIKVLY